MEGEWMDENNEVDDYKLIFNRSLMIILFCYASGAGGRAGSSEFIKC